MKDQGPPSVGELYRHRSNKRVCRVTNVRDISVHGAPMTIVCFKYRRDAAPAAPGLGWKRKTPEQEMPLDQWRSFFTVRTAEASHG